MIRLKNLLLEQIDLIIKAAPANVASKAAQLFLTVFRVREISKDKVGDKDNQTWYTLNDATLLKYLAKNEQVGASSKYADGSYYYVFGKDLRKKQKKEIYDVLLLPKLRVYKIIKGKKSYSNIQDYLQASIPSIGKVGSSDVISFDDLYDAINPSADIGEQTSSGVKITGAYLREKFGEIIDPDDTAAVGSAERIATKTAEEEKRKAEEEARQKSEEENRVNQEWRDVFNSAIADKRVFWAVYNTHNDTDTVYYFMQLSKVQAENPNMYEYIFYTRQRKDVDDTNPTGKGANDGKLFTIDFTKLKEKFSGNDNDTTKAYKIDRYVSNEEFSKITAINDATIFNYLKTKLVGGGSSTGTDKVLLSFTSEVTNKKENLTKTDILKAFGLETEPADNTALSIPAGKSLQAEIIQFILLKDFINGIKTSSQMSDANRKYYLGLKNAAGKSVIDTFANLSDPVDGSYGKISKNVMQLWQFAYYAPDGAFFKSYLDKDAYAYPTYDFFTQTIFKLSSPLTESKRISLKDLLYERNNLTYDYLFEFTPPAKTIVSEPEPEKKTPVKTEPKTTTKTTVKTEPETKKDSETTDDTTNTKGTIPGTANILISGLHSDSSPGYKSIAQQNTLAGTDHVFKWEAASSLDPKGLLYQVLKSNTTGQVICFSKGCEYASEIAALMSDKSNLWIVEPYGTLSIPDGVWNNHVILGPTPDRGSQNLKEGMVETPKGTDHWGALKYAGELATKYQNVMSGEDTEEEESSADDSSNNVLDLIEMFDDWSYKDWISKDGNTKIISLNAKLVLGRWVDIDTKDVDGSIIISENGDVSISDQMYNTLKFKFGSAETLLSGKAGSGGTSLTATLYPQSEFEQPVSVTGTSLSDCIKKAFKAWVVKPEYQGWAAFKKKLSNPFKKHISGPSNLRYINSIYVMPPNTTSTFNAITTF
jgi:hypothetical protein